MKLATFDAGHGNEIGIVTGDEKLISLSRDCPGLATDMIDLIARWDDVKRDVEGAAKGTVTLALADVRLLPPVTRPGKIFAIGLNYADHVKESGMDAPTEQVWFTKAVSALNGAHDPIQIPASSKMVDYEVEMVAIIGKGGRNISKEAALDAVFGYAVGNDVTARDWQFRTPQWSLGKSFDTHAPVGPFITSADEIGDPHRLGIRCLVNGEERQASNTKHLVFNIVDQIVELSQAMTLEPGDLIFTGTPGGVGVAMNPAKFLVPGDIVKCEIDELGAIEAECQNE